MTVVVSGWAPEGVLGGFGELDMARARRTIAASARPAYHRRAVTTDPSTDARAWPPVPLEAWREQALRELKGAPIERLIARVEGLQIEPLYPAEPTALPGRAALLRAPGWTVCPESTHPDPAVAGAAIGRELLRGAGAVWVRLDERLAAGMVGAPAPMGLHGVVVRDADALATLLAGVDLARTPVTLAVGAAGRGVAAMLREALARRGVEAAALRGLLGCDPLATLVNRGALAWSIEHALSDMSEVAAWARAAAPGLRTALVDVGGYHDAGAGAAEQLAVLLASGVAYLRALTADGTAVDAAARQLGFAMAVGRDLFVELAKLRAARLCWARVVAACGGDATAQRMHLHVRGSWRERTAIDPWVGLLRGTGETIAAALGGADSIATVAMDAALGEPGELGRRMARNTQVVLAEESQLGRVADPGGGAGYVEALTDRLARAAWSRFQAIEREGGIVAALRSGSVQREVQANATRQAEAVATLRLPIVGVSRFPAAQEQDPGAEPVVDVLAHETGAQGHVAEDRLMLTGAAAEVVTPLQRARLAAPFEALRAAVQAAAGQVALVAVGSAAQSRARVDFCRGYFAVGGFTVIETAGAIELEAAAQQFAATGARAAVICSADAVYAEVVPRLVPLLRAAGAKVVVLAGRPKDQGEALAAAGVELFVQQGGDALALLAELQRRMEVQS
jgi:methylmalonyl-CoA mutase